MKLRKDAGIVLMVLMLWGMLNPAMALDVGLHGVAGDVGGAALFGFYDTFRDSNCQDHYVTVWSKVEVDRLTKDGLIRSYREFWTCHQACARSL